MAAVSPVWAASAEVCTTRSTAKEDSCHQEKNDQTSGQSLDEACLVLCYVSIIRGIATLVPGLCEPHHSVLSSWCHRQQHSCSSSHVHLFEHAKHTSGSLFASNVQLEHSIVIVHCELALSCYGRASTLGLLRQRVLCSKISSSRSKRRGPVLFPSANTLSRPRYVQLHSQCNRRSLALCLCSYTCQMLCTAVQHMLCLSCQVQ